jgi:CBS domain-containing protein
MSSPIVVIVPELTVIQASTLMRRRGIHSVVIDLTMGAETRYGIVTTSDIRDKIVVSDRDPSEVTVESIMTSPCYLRQA